MKRLGVFLLVVCLIACAAPGSAQTVGNLAVGAFVETAEDAMFYALKDGIYRANMDGSDMRKISPDRASMLQYADGWLYYLADAYEMTEYDSVELTAQTPKRMRTDGSDAAEIAAPREVAYIYDYGEMETSDLTVTTDALIGYGSFTVVGDRAYFLGNTDTHGEYVCHMALEDGEAQGLGVYNHGIALYSMRLDGSELTQLTGVLGNNTAHMAVQDGRIYIVGGYADVNYAYAFVNYGIYDLDGKLITAFHNAQSGEQSFWSDVGEFYHIAQAVQPCGTDGMLVSLCQSEGDFVASEAYALNADGTSAARAIEYAYIPAVLEGETLVYVGTASDTINYDETVDYNASIGVYAAPLDASAAPKLVGRCIDDANVYGAILNVLDGCAYVRDARDELVRVRLDDGEATVLREGRDDA